MVWSVKPMTNAWWEWCCMKQVSDESAVKDGRWVKINVTWWVRVSEWDKERMWWRESSRCETVSRLTGCSVSGDTLQYRLEESAFHWHTRQLFTYLLMHSLYISCIRRYQVSRACDWVMPASSAVLLIISVSNSVCFSSVYRSLGGTSTAAYYRL